MKVWILAKKTNFDSHENQRFREEAEREGIDLQMISNEDVDILVHREGKKSILVNGEHVSLPHALLPRRGAHTQYFDFAIIRHLERMGVFVLNSSHAIEIARDKLHTLQVLAAHKLPIPKTLLARLPLDFDRLEQHFSYPVVIKTLSGSEGKGVLVCYNREQLEDIVHFVELSRNPEVNFIIQEFVAPSEGRDIRVFVVGGRVLGAIERRARPGKVKANVSAGGEARPVDVTPEMEWLAVEAARIVGLEVAGVDLLYGGEAGYLVNEVNSSPGFKGFESATGINVPKEIFHYLRVRLGLPGTA